MAIITPKVLMDNDYIKVAKESDMETVEALFNEEAGKISPILKPFGASSVNRSDPGLTFDLEEIGFPCSPKDLMKLIKRGDIPKYFTERKENDKKEHRKKADRDSFYLENASVGINFYWKYPKIKKGHPDFPSKEKYRNIMRLEVELKYRKLYALSKNIRHKSKFYKSPEEMSTDELWRTIENDMRRPAIPIDVVLTDDFAAGIINKYLSKIIGQGDYLTLDGARWIVQAHHFRKDKEERLISALEFINECRGIAKAKAKLQGDDLRNLKRSIKDLNGICVNPVTIPRKWGIEHIPNPLDAYYQSITGERLVFGVELEFKKLFREYLAK